MAALLLFQTLLQRLHQLVEPTERFDEGLLFRRQMLLGQLAQQSSGRDSTSTPSPPDKTLSPRKCSENT